MIKRIIGYVLLGVLLCSCTIGFVSKDTDGDSALVSPVAPALPNAEETAQVQADAAVQALQAQDMEALAALVHPTEGIRFTPYALVSELDQVFTAEQVPGLFLDSTRYVWGYYDGSGMPIELTFAEYYQEFIYDHDFAHAREVGHNQIIGAGNSINNIATFYPDAAVVEYHFPGFDPRYAGTDWASLRLVFQKQDGVWYLIGIVHDQWTI